MLIDLALYTCTSINLFKPTIGKASCLSEDWREVKELGKMQLSCSKEGNRVYLPLFPLEKFKDGKKPTSFNDIHLLPTRVQNGHTRL